VKPLHDGRQVSSDSPEWRLECLARHVLAQRSRKAMEEWLEKCRFDTGELRSRMNAIREADKTRQLVTKRGSAQAAQ
jgi:hypothetical protein